MAINLIQLKYEYKYEDDEAIFIYKCILQIRRHKFHHKRCLLAMQFSISNKNKCTKIINADLKLEINETKTPPHLECKMI